jgi:putative cardiolipin synthase
MHNKLFAADNQFAITGGRNIGDEYFLAHDEFSFVDLDVMASGPVVADLSDSFDAYWASDVVVPVRALPGYREARTRLDKLKEGLKRRKTELEDSDYGRGLKGLQFEARLLSGKLPAYRGAGHAIADPPGKADGDTHVSELLVGQLSGLGIDARQELIVVSPYFVPGQIGMDWFGYLRGRGVKVRVLTNSLAASDVPVVHAGYAAYRRELLKLGVELHELKPQPNARPQKTRIVGSGSSRSSLHAKSLVFDRERVFIGSFNFDPRSALLNTELGLVINCPEAAAHVVGMAEKAMDPSNSHRLSLRVNDEGESVIVWSSRSGQKEYTTDTEPNTTWWQRQWLDFMTLLPIEEHL